MNMSNPHTARVPNKLKTKKSYVTNRLKSQELVYESS